MKKRTKLDTIFYGGENRSPNLPHKTAKKKAKSSEETSPTVIVSSPDVVEVSPPPRDFRTARELFQEEQNQQLAVPMEVEVEALVNLDVSEEPEPAGVLVEEEHLAAGRIAQERLDQIARVFAPLDRRENVPEPDFLRDGQNYINKKIIEELKEHGEFLYKGQYGRCWANYPSHSEVYLQPLDSEESKLFFKSNHTLPTSGSTWTSAIYKRENGEIVPVHIISESVLGEIYRLKEYRIKFQSKNIPHLSKLCLIIKVKDEVAKNSLIQRYVDYVNSVISNTDHFPIIRICYKENQAYKLTRELDVHSVVELNRRMTLESHFQTLQVFVNAYEQANRTLLDNIHGLSEKGDILSFKGDDVVAESVLAQYTLEDIEEYNGYLLVLKKELLRIKGSMEVARLQADGANEFLAHVIDDIRKINVLISDLHEVSEGYRDYLYQMDSFLCLGEYRLNPALPSTQIENILMQKIRYWVEYNNLDSDFLDQFELARILLAKLFSSEVLMEELRQVPLPLERQMELVTTMVNTLHELAVNVNSPLLFSR